MEWRGLARILVGVCSFLLCVADGRAEPEVVKAVLIEAWPDRPDRGSTGGEARKGAGLRHVRAGIVRFEVTNASRITTFDVTIARVDTSAANTAHANGILERLAEMPGISPGELSAVSLHMKPGSYVMFADEFSPSQSVSINVE